MVTIFPGKLSFALSDCICRRDLIRNLKFKVARVYAEIWTRADTAVDSDRQFEDKLSALFRKIARDCNSVLSLVCYSVCSARGGPG